MQAELGKCEEEICYVNERAGLMVYALTAEKMVSFNEDPEFGNTLDCLVLVDLANSPERIMKRYRGQ